MKIALVTFAGFATASHVRADDGCDSSEAVACIPLPPDTSTSIGSASAGGASAASGQAATIAAAPVPGPVPPQLCPMTGCCSPFAGPATAEAPASAVPSSPVPGYCFPCYPPSPVAGASAPALQSPAIAAPVPIPLPCSPYRRIYTTINFGNAADVRALRTLSTQGLSSYWRRGALEQVQQQVAQLELAGIYVTARLYSIQVQGRSIDAGGRSVTVHTLEHWLYQQRSMDDGSILFSQDQWAANEYDLSLIGSSWYITDNNATLASGPAPVPLPATGN